MNIFRKKQKDILPISTLPQKETIKPTAVKETKTSLPRILIYGTERVNKEEIISIFTKQYGWLCVSQDNYEVKSQ